MPTHDMRECASRQSDRAGSYDATARLGDRELAAWRTLLNAHAAVIDRIERELAAAGHISLGAYDVLLSLYEAPGRRLRMGELARAVLLNKSTLTRRVDQLEARGLLVRERECAGGDKRGAYAVLTEQGIAAMRGAWPVYARGIQEHFVRHLEEAELAPLTTALARVFAAARSG